MRKLLFGCLLMALLVSCSKDEPLTKPVDKCASCHRVDSNRVIDAIAVK